MVSIDDLFDPAAPMSDAELDALSGPVVGRGSGPRAGRSPTLDLRAEQAQAELEAQLAGPSGRARPSRLVLDEALAEPLGPALAEDLIAAGLGRSRWRSFVVLVLAALAVLGGLGWWAALDEESARASQLESLE